MRWRDAVGRSDSPDAIRIDLDRTYTVWLGREKAVQAGLTELMALEIMLRIGTHGGRVYRVLSLAISQGAPPNRTMPPDPARSDHEIGMALIWTYRGIAYYTPTLNDWGMDSMDCGLWNPDGLSEEAQA